MIKLLKESLEDLVKVHKQVIAFQFVYFFLTGLIFVPMLTGIFGRTIKSLGVGVLVNQDIFKLGFNYRGILGILMIVVLSVVIIFIEISVLVMISQKQYFNHEVTFSDALVTTMRRITKIFGFGVFQLIFLLLFLIPAVDSPLANSIIESVNIPIWLRLQVIESNWISIVYGIAFMVVIYLVLRWIFTIHYVVIENQPSRKAIINSQRLTRKNELRIILVLVLFNIVTIGIGIGLISTLNYIPNFLTNEIKSDLLEKYLMTLSGYLTFGLTLIILPINIMWITHLFYKFREQSGEEVKDTLNLKHVKYLNKLECLIENFYCPRRYLLLFALMIYLTVTFIINYTATEDILRWNVEIAAHRGGGYSAPENSLSSIQNSLDKGITVIEIDVQMTKDGVVVLNHDLNLNRVAGVKSEVSQLTFEELKRIDIGFDYESDYLGEQVPTLEAALTRVKDKARLIIEIKYNSYSQELAQNIVALIEEQNMVGQCMIQSFSYDVLRDVRKLNSDILLGQVLYAVVGNLDTLDVDFYTIKQSILSDGFIKNAQRNERSVWVWTVNEEANIKEVLKYDINGIITDYPGRVKTFMGR